MPLLPAEINPLEVQRQVTLAFSLEATFPKTECTSRYQDISPQQRFEDFLISAINSGEYFYRLAERIKNEQKQPRIIYDLASACLKESTRNRQGKIVNYGLIETMFPVVAAKCLYGKEAEKTLELVPEVLKKTSPEDVHYVSEMRRIVYSRSNKEFKRSFPFNEIGSNVWEHYQHHLTLAPRVSKQFVEEILKGMPLAKQIYQSLAAEGEQPLGKKIPAGFAQAKLASGLPAGAVADFTAVALYLLIAGEKEEKRIKI
jgi:triphosphoribosyl-dephospho-CoA synthetase